MLGEQELHAGGRPQNRLHDVTGIELPPKLCDLGISLMQSHRWQLSASVLGEQVTAGNPQFFDDQRIVTPKLKDLGISEVQSHRWQLSASVPGERDTELHPVSRERLLPEGGRPKLSHDVIVSPKLNELGISLMQSHRWQLSASVSR
jgi:hypothetical protein